MFSAAGAIAAGWLLLVGLRAALGGLIFIAAALAAGLFLFRAWADCRRGRLTIALFAAGLWLLGLRAAARRLALLSFFAAGVLRIGLRLPTGALAFFRARRRF